MLSSVFNLESVGHPGEKNMIKYYCGKAIKDWVANSKCSLVTDSLKVVQF